MAPSDSASVTVSRRGSAPDDCDPQYTIVWLHGEHDIATKVSVVVTIARAAQRDDADLIVDLSKVTFMDASTIGALVESRNRLRARSRSLLLRSPSPPARRILDLCGLAHLVHEAGEEPLQHAGMAAALRTWVDVPAVAPPEGKVDLPAPVAWPQTAPPMLSAAAQPSRTSPMTGADRSAP